MVKSMTGFATIEHSMPEGTLQIDLRSVNHRYFEASFKMDDDLRVFEHEMREMLQAEIKRGKIDCRVMFRSTSNQPQAKASIDPVAIQQLTDLIAESKQYINDAQPINVLDVLKMPGIVQSASIKPETLLGAIKQTMPTVIADLSSARAREGEKLKTVILERLSSVAKLVNEVKPLMPELITAYQAKLTEKLKQAIAEEDERVRQEVVIYAQKIDIDEELSRLEAHIAEVGSILSKGGLVGKRLDFLMQEMNREANTLGSKSVSIKTTNASMQLKVLIEQMREQIQNIE